MEEVSGKHHYYQCKSCGKVFWLSDSTRKFLDKHCYEGNLYSLSLYALDKVVSCCDNPDIYHHYLQTEAKEIRRARIENTLITAALTGKNEK